MDTCNACGEDTLRALFEDGVVVRYECTNTIAGCAGPEDETEEVEDHG